MYLCTFSIDNKENRECMTDNQYSAALGDSCNIELTLRVRSLSGKQESL